jgi:uncharacterized protein (DUF924 family)
MADAHAILEFWFGPDETVSAHHQQQWFAADPAFDRLCVERFAGDYAAAAAGQLDEWRREPRSCLALVLLLDQFPRNMFRDTPRAFATDTAARRVARGAITEGFDRELSPLQRVFFYMPFEHSEQITDQDESVRLFRDLAGDYPECSSFLRYAESHREVIRRFGRFPLRNAVLNRASTLDETAYIREHSGY